MKAIGFVEMKTAELIGPALDWAVAMADQEEHPNVYEGVVYVNGPKHNAFSTAFQPSTDWAQGGPLLDRYAIELERSHTRKVWTAVRDNSLVEDGEVSEQTGPTALVGLCRVIVSSELGDVVQVPVGLCTRVQVTPCEFVYIAQGALTFTGEITIHGESE